MSPLPPIVSPGWLAARRIEQADGGPPVHLVDVRHYLDGRDGLAAYRAGHLPGAVHVDLDTVLAGPPSAAAGRHPLPDPEVLAAGLAAAGIGHDGLVIAYDDLGGMMAARLVWMLRISGDAAALLDGGLAGWEGELERGDPAITPADRQARPWPDGAVATAAEVQAHLDAGGRVVDCRAAERYRGETEPIDPRAGHIPGASNVPFSGNLAADGRFLAPAQLAERFAAAGVDQAAIFYCGSGVSACHNLLAMEATGQRLPRLYVGSWSQWSADETRPIASGDA